MLGVSGLPGDPSRKRDSAPAEQPALEPEVIPAEGPLALELPKVRRDFWIRKQDVAQYGYTRHCPKCDAMRQGTATDTAHIKACI